MLQAVLSNHPSISSCSEPWIQFLPAVFSRPDLVSAKFSWGHTLSALKNAYSQVDFVKRASDQSYDLIDIFYEQQSKGGNHHYFLDKTPRYFFITEEIYNNYPDAKFILLHRDPLAVVASMMKTWFSNAPIELLYSHAQDIIEAPRLMHQFTTAHSKCPRIFTTDYLSLTNGDDFEKIFRWLDIEFEVDLLQYHSNSAFRGKFGDPHSVLSGQVRSINEDRPFCDVFPTRRMRNFASGLAHYYQVNGFDYNPEISGVPVRRGKEFDRMVRSYNLAQGDNFSAVLCARYAFDRLLRKLGM